MRWYVVPSLAGPSAVVAGDLVFVVDLGSDEENEAAARSALATAQSLEIPQQ
jgi:hypothetical protein